MTCFVSIMQGRLVPPIDNKIQAFPRQQWSEEFPRAAEAGLDGIEWIYDAFGQDVNPIATVESVQQIIELSRKHRVIVRSLCADYFMEYPLLRASAEELQPRLRLLEWLMTRCRAAGITRIVLPFVDNSAIHDQVDSASVAELLRSMLPAAETNRVELHLETSLAPQPFADLLAQVSSPFIRVNYDSGNSASLGYNPRDEFMAYGDRVGSVHVKDRRRGGGTVPLGTGDADLPALFASLKAVHYTGDIVLQVARGESGAEVSWARQNREFVSRYWA
jgi:L-ribulose-5-phosphate 3-epimerase